MHRRLGFRASVACAVLVGGGTPARSAPGCVTEGVLDGGELTLAPEPAEPFVVRLREEARVRVAFRDAVAPHVEAIGRAATVAGPGQVVHHLRTVASLEGSILFINEAATITDLRYSDGVLRASVLLDEHLVAKGVDVPCDRLHAGRRTAINVPRGRPEPRSIGMARARRRDLIVYRAPNTGTGVHLFVEPESVTFDVLRRQNGWVKIAWDGETGNLRGWLRSTDARLVTSFIGTRGGSIGCCAVPRLAKGATSHTVKLRDGTSIHASPGGPQWGVVHIDLDDVEVEDVPGNDWLRVLKNAILEETACDPTRSWIRRSNVEFSGAVIRGGDRAAEPGVADGAAPRR